MAQTTARPPLAREKLPAAEVVEPVRVVVEATSKALKLHQFWSYAVIFLGALVAAAGSMVAASLSQDFFTAEAVLFLGLGISALGLVWAAVTKMRIWWHHE